VNLLGYGLALALVAASSPATASDDGGELCASLRVDVPAELGPEWASAAAALPRELGDALSSAECAHVRVALAAGTAGAADVHVGMPDGREASRHVRAPRALFPIVLGLLASAPAEPVPEPPGPTHDRHELPDFTPPPAPPHPDADRVGVSVGFGLGARGGLPTQVIMADVELFAEVVLRDWLILASVRYAPIAVAKGLTPDGDAYQEAGIGLGFGRRFHLDRSSLDVAFVPTLVLVSMETDLPAEAFGTLSDLRLDACARYGYALGKRWRFNVTLDTDVSPNALVRPQLPAPGLLPVPAWTLGLRVGMSASIF
jgi:hypothetical protein